MERPRAYRLSVFPHSLDAKEDGGNPTTIFLDADNLSSGQMQALTKEGGHECGFVLRGRAGVENPSNFTMRYWVPNHEMEMCGHATVGAVWIMDQLGLLPPDGRILISTKSGEVEARVDREGGSGSETRVFVSQPAGAVEDLPDNRVLETLSSLGITPDELAPGYKIQNGCTSRMKTLIPLKNHNILDRLRLDPDAVLEVCEKIHSTGLYPYAVINAEDQVVEARQFPKSAGYAEDPATGIAAAALAFGLLRNGMLPIQTTRPLFVRQGWFMGKPSEIHVLFRLRQGNVEGCWISGKVKWMRSDKHNDE
ncbi:uncharacterized protein N7482_004457 [Penicillium canariense]|uniref:Uncharacterized protein n=1 Tax=Penicillium canariense TaxID=189055 RepID=A0A9W9LQJ2_9EURO|nr:uncharacterized protein N7482_004457 [Penicillium canariense]KAJ5168863.1 hypothetical protein N7482_004457 [Penicillium canariense]